MAYSTRVLLWRDFFDDELVLFGTGFEPEEEGSPDAPPRGICVLGALHLDSILDLFGYGAFRRVAQATRDESLYPVEISLRFYNEDEV
jgi:hypothetical protein